MADNSKIPLKNRIEGRIKSFEFALTVADDYAKSLILDRIAQLKRQLSLVKGDE